MAAEMGSDVELSMSGGRSHMMVNYDSNGMGSIPRDSPHNDTINGDTKNSQTVGGSGVASSVKSGLSGFLNHMLLFDSNTKVDLLNLAQYALLGVGPVVLMLKTIKNYFPNANESKGTPELALECTLEILFILFCIYYIHRFICYIPTYSGVKYERVNFTQTVLMFLVILFTIQTKLGTKINILVRRATHVVEGYSSFGREGDEDEAEESRDATKMMSGSLENHMIVSQSQPLAGAQPPQPPTSFGPNAAPSLVPTSAPGLGHQRMEGGNSPRSSGREHDYSNVPNAMESFSSGSLSGTAW